MDIWSFSQFDIFTEYLGLTLTYPGLREIQRAHFCFILQNNPRQTDDKKDDKQ